MTQPIQTPRICTDDEANIIFQCMDEVKSEARKGKTSTVSFRKMQEEISKYIENGEVYMNLHADKPEQKLQQQKSKELFDELKRSRDAVNEITKTISQGQKTLRQEYSAVVRKYYESVVRLEKNVQENENLILETVEKQKKTERNESVEAIRVTLAKVFKDIRSAVQFLKNEFKPLEMGLYKGKTLSDRAEECKQMVENSIAGKFKKLNENYPYLVNNIHSKRAMSLLNCDSNNIRVLIEYFIANFKYSEHRDSQREVMDTACSDATKAIDECLEPTLLDIDEKFDSIKKTMEASKNSMQKLDETKESEMLDYALYFETSKAKDWALLFCKFPAFVIFAKTYHNLGAKHVIDAEYQIPSHLQPLRGAFWKLLYTLLRLLHEKEAQDLEYDLVAAEQKMICILLKKVVFKTRKALFMMQAIKNMQISAEDRRIIMSLPNQILNAISSIYTLHRITYMIQDQDKILVDTKQILVQHTTQIDNMVERLNNEETQESDLDTGSSAIASNHINQRHAIFELSNIEIIKRLGEEHEKINEDLIKRFNERSRKRKDMGMACEHDHSYNFDCEFSKSNEFVLANEANERGGVAKGIATTLNEGIKQTSNETKKSLDEQHLYLMRKIANFFSTLSKLYYQRSEQIKLKYQISLSKKELEHFKTNLQHNEQIQELAQRNINCLDKHSDLAILITNSVSLVSQAKDLLNEIDCLLGINQKEQFAYLNEHKNVQEKIKAFVCNLFEKGPESQASIAHKIKDAVDILEQFNDEHIVVKETKKYNIDIERCEDITIVLDYFLDFYPIQENESDKNVKNLIRAQERKLIAWMKREGCSLICYENTLMLRTGYTPREFYYGKKMDVLDKEDDAVEVDEKNLNNMDDTPKVKKYKNCDSAEAVDLNHSTTYISSTTDMDEQNKNNHENAVEREKQGACADCGTSTEVSGKDDDAEPKKVELESCKTLNVKNNWGALGQDNVKPDRYEANIGSAPENKMTFDRSCLDPNEKRLQNSTSDRGFEGSNRAQKQVTVPQYMNEGGNKSQSNILKDNRNLLPLHAKENLTAEVECEKRQKDLHPLEESGARNMPLKEQPDCGTKNKKLSGKSNAKTSWQRILLISTFVALAAGLIVTVVYFRWYGSPK